MKQNNGHPRSNNVKKTPPAKVGNTTGGSKKANKFKSPIDDVFSRYTYQRRTTGRVSESSAGNQRIVSNTNYKRSNHPPPSVHHHQQHRQQIQVGRGNNNSNYHSGGNRQSLSTLPRRRGFMNNHQTQYEGGNPSKRRYTSAQQHQQSSSYTKSSSSSSSTSIKYFEMKLPNRQRIYENELEMIYNSNNNNNSSTTTSFPCWMKSKTDNRANGNKPNKGNYLLNKAPRDVGITIQDILHHIREDSSTGSSAQHENINNYNNEMHSLTQFIQLSPQEVHLRNQFVVQLEEQIQQLQIAPQQQQQQSPSILYTNRNKPHPQYCHVFGSFASIPICTFQSDLDIALFNVGIEGNYKSSAPTSTALATVPSVATTDISLSIPLKESDNSNDVKSNEVIIIDEADDEPKTNEVIIIDDADDEPNIQNLVEAASTGIPKNSPSNITTTKQQRKAMLVAKWKQALELSSTTVNDNDDNCDRPENGDENYEEDDDFNRSYAGSDEDDSENDSADPMTSYQQQDNDKRGRKRAYSDSTILSINSSSGSVAGHTKPLSDNTGDSMTVSFFASKPPPTISSSAATTSIGPQGYVRVKVVGVLATLCNKLRKKSISRSMQIQNITFIKTARVPIIKIQLLSGFNVDVAIGGYGTDTSLYAAQQIQLYPNIFVPVVVFLKVLLTQHNLDEPYTGGLGSYKLYILIADHIYRHRQWCNDSNSGCRDSFDQIGPFEILFTFLYRYGYGSREVQDWGPVLQYPTTKLLQHQPLISATEDTTCADLSNVYKLQDCIILFRLCFQRLYLQISERFADTKRGSTVRPQQSVLAHVICPFQLLSSRERILQQTKQFHTESNITIATPTSSSDAMEEPTERILSISNSSIVSYSTRPAASSNRNNLPQRDRTMNEIIAGYGG